VEAALLSSGTMASTGGEFRSSGVQEFGSSGSSGSSGVREFRKFRSSVVTIVSSSMARFAVRRSLCVGFGFPKRCDLVGLLTPVTPELL